MNRRVILVILLVTWMQAINSCQIKAVHITLGDYFADSSSSHLYTVGFMSPTECSIGELKLGAFAHGYFEEFEEPFFQQRHYIAPKESKIEYDRYFYFAHIDKEKVKKSPCKFYYYIGYNDKSTKNFQFHSQFYCNENARIYTLGNHDISPTGLDTLIALSNQKIDLLLLPGNFPAYYHTNNGSMGDQYFEEIEPLLTQVVFIVLPAFNEKFDDYKMFNSRFRMPGCSYDNLNCDLYKVTTTTLNIIVINLERQLYNPQFNRRSLLEETRLLMERIDSDEIIRRNWLFVMTNLPFYCSDNKSTYPCIQTLFYVKPYDDLFSHFFVNLVLNSAMPSYESITNVFNFNMSIERIRQFLTTGTAGSKFLHSSIPVEASALSQKVINHQQAITMISLFPDYYKIDLLEIPTMLSIDVEYIDIWDLGQNWFRIGFSVFIMVGVLFGMNLFRPSNIARYFSGRLDRLKKRKEEKLRKLAEEAH